MHGYISSALIDHWETSHAADVLRTFELLDS